MSYSQHGRLKVVSVALLAIAEILFTGLVVGSGEYNIFFHGANQPRLVLNITHAGAASIAPQNTIIAGEKALAAGADLWGIDTRITKDGVLVLMHDETLTRTTNVKQVFPDRAPWLVKDFTLAEIKRLDAGSWFVNTDPFGQIKAGDVSPADQRAYVGTPVPTLREALLFTKAHHWRMDIEAKPMDYLTPAQIADKLVALIQATSMEDWVMVSSFDHRILVQVKKLDSRIPTAALVVFPPLDPVGFLKKLGADGYEPSPIAISPEIAADLGGHGYGVYVWTYNSVDQLRHFATMPGITGIYTDFPQRLAPILAELYGPKPGR